MLVSEETAARVTVDYAGLGYVGNPFPPIDESSSDPYWMRIITNAASNGLLSGVMRARSGERSRPVAVAMAADVPEYYYRASQNAFLSRTAREEALGMMALNIPLDMMRLGSIRGTLAEVAELVAAVDLPTTVGAYLADALGTPLAELAEYVAAGPETIEQARVAFTDDPESAFDRFLGDQTTASSRAPSVEEDDALHAVYLRQTVLDKEPDEAQEAGSGEDPQALGSAEVEASDAVSPDDLVGSYLIAHLRSDLGPVVARAVRAYRDWGSTIVAQELKVTKAPRKTLSAVLRLMSHRWPCVVVLYDRFDAWPMLEQQTKMDVLGALTELRWIIGVHGVMGVALVDAQAIEIEEQFAAAEHVDWSMPELTPLYSGDVAFASDRVQRWLDAASIVGLSPVKADGPELKPIVDACENDVLRYAMMAEAAFRNAAERGSAVIDAEAVSAGLASVEPEDGV
jgi:hypothetical protein